MHFCTTPWSTLGRWSVGLAVVLILCRLTHGQSTGEEITAETQGEVAAPATAAPSVVGQAVLQLPRTTAAEHLRTVINLYDLGEVLLAQEVLSELTALELPPTVRAELVRRFGSYRLLQLARDPDLGPVAQPFADACLNAAAAMSRDPQRLASIVQRLSDPSCAVRQAAISELDDAGIEGIRFAAEALAREQDALTRRELTRALIVAEPLSVPPLLAMLSTDDPSLLADVIQALAYLEVPQAAPLLVAPALLSIGDSPTARTAQQAYSRLTGRRLSRQRAREQLRQSIRSYLDGAIPFTPDANDRIQLWFWDDDAGQLSAESYPREEARVIWAARLAKDLYRLDPARVNHRELALMLAWESATLRQSYEVSLASLALEPWLVEAAELHAADPHRLSRLLDTALEHGHTGAAKIACEMLAKSADFTVLLTADSSLSPLARTLSSPNRRVQFAGLQAILAWDPPAAFPGSSHVAEVLNSFAGESQEPVVLVGMPQLEQAANTAALLRGHDFTAIISNTGRELMEEARKHGFAEFVVLDININTPGVHEVLYQLRSLRQTAGAPIALLAPTGRLADAQRVAARHDDVMAVYRPHSMEAAGAIVDGLVGLAGRDYLSPAERLEQSTSALEQIEELLRDGSKLYSARHATGVLENVLYRPNQALGAIRSLAWVHAPESQRALVGYASLSRAPIEARKKAAEAFQQSVERHGLLLTSPEIRHQYERYNAGALAEAETREVLAQLLDTIESQRSP